MSLSLPLSLSTEETARTNTNHHLGNRHGDGVGVSNIELQITRGGDHLSGPSNTVKVDLLVEAFHHSKDGIVDERARQTMH